MSWRSFVGYVQMREAGETDTTYRGHDLLYYGMTKTKEAAARAGALVTKHSIGLPTIHRQLHNINIPIDVKLTEQYLNEWYVWDRIQKGEVIKWPIHKTTGVRL